MSTCLHMCYFISNLLIAEKTHTQLMTITITQAFKIVTASIMFTFKVIFINLIII